MATPKQQSYENLAESLIEAFNRRGIEGYYCTDKEDALSTALRFLTPGCSVSWGGSMSCTEIGLFEALKTSDCILYDRSTAKTPDEQRALYAKTVTADYYFMSSNAVTLDGELVNIDGNGNRVGMIVYGPKNIIVVAGMNKVCQSLEDAVKRARTVAAPMNQQRFGLPNPCTCTGVCADCLTETSICNQILITRNCKPAGRIKFVLVGEELGF